MTHIHISDLGLKFAIWNPMMVAKHQNNNENEDYDSKGWAEVQCFNSWVLRYCWKTDQCKIIKIRTDNIR